MAATLEKAAGVSSARIRHVPALDGLRGAALLGVLFFHANGALPGGYLGVDLFFVLSGFLITSLLLAEHRATGKIALSTFWVRRARRLFPALLSLMPAIALYGRFVAKPEELSGIRADALATLAYVANWRAIFSHKSYWELFAAPSPLEHTWSLSIEEQFYVVWPLIVVVVLKRGTARWLLALSLVLTAASMAAMVRLSLVDSTSRAYLGTDTRATAILVGAALATFIAPGVTFTKNKTRALDALGLFSAIGLGIAWWKLDGASTLLYRGGFWITEGGALVLITCAASGEKSLIARALSFRPLAYIGTISYGAYLWHWPIDVYLSHERTHLRGFWLHALQLALTFVIAALSAKYFEQPIRSRGLPFGRPVIVVPAAIALSVLLVVRATYARKPIDPELPPLTSAPLDRGPMEVAPPFRVMLLGDSTANSLGWGLRGVRQPGVSVELKGKDSCTMLWDTCGGEVWPTETQEIRPNATLIYLGGAYLHGIDADGKWRKSCHPGWDKKFLDTLTRRLAGLTSPETRVWLVTLPYPLGPYDNETFRTETDCINVLIRKAADAVPGIEILDLGERLCPKGQCVRELADGTTVRPDGVHFTIEGSAEVSRWVLEEIQR